MSEDPRRERILAELREQAARQREAGSEPVDDAEAAAEMEALLRTVRAFNVAPPSFDPIKPPFEHLDIEPPVIDAIPVRPGAHEPLAERRPGKPRDVFLAEDVALLIEELRSRRAAGKPRKGRLTKRDIHRRFKSRGISRSRIDVIEILVDVWWPETPELRATNGRVILPTLEEARRLQG